MKQNQLFKTKPKNILNIYFTAGYPKKNSLLQILPALENAGVDMVEIGIPYSDPLSDGPTIQKSNAIALENGITIDQIFEQLKGTSTSIVKIMMGYFNTILQYGIEKFCKKCSENAIYGIIIPDLPLEYYLKEYQNLFKTYNLHFILLVTPETTEERIRFIDKNSTAFIYAVSSSSTTGNKKITVQDAESYLKRLRTMQLKSPILVGFNISSKKDIAFVNKYANGAIIGSAFIKSINNSKTLTNDISKFITRLQ